MTRDEAIKELQELIQVELSWGNTKRNSATIAAFELALTDMRKAKENEGWFGWPQCPRCAAVASSVDDSYGMCGLCGEQFEVEKRYRVKT
jgi:hypothetical protein